MDWLLARKREFRKNWIPVFTRMTFKIEPAASGLFLHMVRGIVNSLFDETLYGHVALLESRIVLHSLTDPL